MIDRIADALVLTFTATVSLREWVRSGMLAREWALYERLAPHFGRIVFVTYGGRDEHDIARTLSHPVEVVCNEQGLDLARYQAAVPQAVLARLGEAATILIKTNQMQGGAVAARTAERLRAAGKRVGLIARGGFLWSQFVARAEGSQAQAARDAADAESELCRAADVVVGTTGHMLDDLAWRYGIEHASLILIPNYVRIESAAQSPEQRDPATILYAGQLVRRKRVDLLIDAMSLLGDDARAAATLLIVGEGPERETLRAKAASLSVRAEFRPRMPHADLMNLMARCTVYAQASEYEGHPKTVIEAMACGAPVVVADSPGLGAVVEHGLSGLRVSAQPAAFARAFEGLLADADWREALGAAAANHIRDRFGLPAILNMELDAHRRAMLRAGARAPAPPPPVRWEPDLLERPLQDQVAAWERALRGFARRLDPPARARFLMALDNPVYVMQGEAAIDADGGLHPKHRLMKYHDFFVDRAGPANRVIDLGCGVGALAASIAQRSGATVVGMDWSDENLQKARARAADLNLGDRLRFVTGDITKDRAPGAFDTVVLSNVLEHVTDRAARLRAWAQWYRAERFLIRVPAFDREWRAPFKRELGVEWRLDTTHETEYTEEALRAELSDAGLLVGELVTRWGEYWLEARVRTPAQAAA